MINTAHDAHQKYRNANSILIAGPFLLAHARGVGHSPAGCSYIPTGAVATATFASNLAAAKLVAGGTLQAADPWLVQPQNAHSLHIISQNSPEREFSKWNHITRVYINL